LNKVVYTEEMTPNPVIDALHSDNHYFEIRQQPLFPVVFLLSNFLSPL